MSYDAPYYTGIEVDPGDVPPMGCLRKGMEWDEGNLQHIDDLTSGQVEHGVGAGYYYLEDDPDPDRFRFLFQPVPSLLDSRSEQPSVYRLIIDTGRGRMRPVSVMRETRTSAIREYMKAKAGGDLE